MALIDQKKNIFTTIGAYTSMNNGEKMPDTSNIFPSINNKKDVVPLLLDILKVVVGTDALQQLTGELFTNMIDSTEPELKAGVKKQSIQYNSGSVVSNKFKNNGYNVPVKNIDLYGKLKTDPESQTGSMLYDNTTPNFDSTAYQAIRNNGTDTVFGNLIMNYNSSTDEFNFKPNLAVDPNPTVGSFLGEFVDNMTIVNKKEFTTSVMNSIYGTISNNQGKSVESVVDELSINKLIEQIINDNNSFIISPSDYEALLRQAQEIADGVIYYDMGCGLLGASLPLDNLFNLINNISGSTDPFYVGNQVNNTINESIPNQQVADENKQTVKDGFFQKLIKLITLIYAQSVCTTPQIRTLLAISSAFQNNDETQIGNPLNDLKNFKIYLNCIIKDAMRLMNKFIYQLVVTFLIALLTPIIKMIIREKINQYVGVIKSLSPA